MIKRTISDNLFNRMAAQAEEADIQGNEKVATVLTDLLVKYADEGVRTDEVNADYEYSHKNLKEDIKVLLWSAAMRVFDYYEKLPDARNIDDAVSTLVDDVFNVFDNLVEGEVVGKYEPKTPGEAPEETQEGTVEDEESLVITSPDIESVKKSVVIVDEDDDNDNNEEEEIETKEKE